MLSAKLQASLQVLNVLIMISTPSPVLWRWTVHSTHHVGLGKIVSRLNFTFWRGGGRLRRWQRGRTEEGWGLSHPGAGCMMADFQGPDA